MADHDDVTSRQHWVQLWQGRQTFEARGLDKEASDDSPRRYVLTMFPYPSGDLHMGHAEVYSIGDALARFARLRGHNVLHPVGWDSFGLPAENAALRQDLDPREWTYKNIEIQAEGFRELGISFDWRTRLHTSDPDFYRWNQWIFLRMYREGLAYRDNSRVNWCPVDKTVLANEQVVQGRCERCGSAVESKSLIQWFFRISRYAQRLLDDMALLSEWPDDVLNMQRNWIGRSVGAYVDFEVDGQAAPLKIFTTRPDTLFGATFVVIAADAPLAGDLCARSHRDAFDRYVAEVQGRSDVDRLSMARGMTGVFLGSYATNPVNGERLPIFASEYVLAGYGSGAIMAVPAHDQRDLDFARAVDLPVRVVIDTGEADPIRTGVATTSPGTLSNSGPYTGTSSGDASAMIVAALEEQGRAEPAVHYRLRDWLISRQRYWGTPIPIIHCPACGEVPVPESDLPVTLPSVDFNLRRDDGTGPLAGATEWVHVACPTCARPAVRDTDTMDTFVDSSWYFLRYPDPQWSDGPFNPAGIDRWLPVDEYIGGKEHAILHLLYARFMTKVLHDMGMLPFEEPFVRLTNQGQVLMGGRSMSKSLGNLVDLQEQVAQYGSDAMRVTMLFAGPPEDDIDWADVSPAGAVKWLARVRRLGEAIGSTPPVPNGEDDVETRRLVHRLLHEITELMDGRRINVAIARSMELTSVLRRAIDAGARPSCPALREGVEALARVISCFAPFAAEEVWATLGHEPSVVDHGWPDVDDSLLEVAFVTCIVQINGKLRDRLDVPPDIGDNELRDLVIELPAVRRHVDGKRIERVIVRAPHVVNLVVSS